MKGTMRTKINRINLIAAFFFCSIFSFAALAQDNPLSAEQLTNLVAGLKGALKENLATVPTGEKSFRVITQKWDARRDLAGKSKNEVIDLLYRDVESEVKDSGMRYQISQVFSFYRQMPDSQFSGSGKFKDPRDGQVYGTKKLGKLTWMTQNLRFDVADGSWCFGNDRKNCAALGRLYTFEAALEACPSGWRLPADSDWLDLEKALGIPQNQLMIDGYSTARGAGVGQKLKTGGSSGLEFVISGYAAVGDGEPEFDGIGGDRPRSYFWTATSRTVNGETVAFRRRIEAKNGNIYRFANPTEGYAISVRCVQ